VRVLQLWAELIEVARQPWPRNVQVGTAILDEYESRRHPIGPLARYTDGADVPLELFAQTVRADPLITDRCARTAVAVERYRRDHDGAPPHTLSDLVPHYLAAIPADPFTGAPLLYRAAADGGAYTIYSVGPNQKDDGGDLTSELQQVIKRGWGRRIIRGADVGVRVLMSRPRL
jgi:hypothetical protein